MRKVIISLMTVLMLTGLTGNGSRDEVAPTPPRIMPIAIDSNLVSCQDRSNHISYDPELDTVPEYPVDRNMQLALARICVSESGFQVRTNDCTLIYHALRTRSRTGELTMSIMRAYAPKSFNLRRTDGHAWVAHLRHDFGEPRHWRERTSIPWSTRRSGFREVYDHAGYLLRTRPENSCGIRIDHWGAKHFRRYRHIRDGWHPIECGETLNQFWSLPQ